MGFLSSIFGGSSNKQQVWGGQTPYLMGLYQNATNSAGGAANRLNQLTNSYLGQGGQALGNLGMIGQVGNPFVQQSLGALAGNLGSLFQNQINPSIRSDFAGMGQLGGSRQAVAQGLASQGISNAFATGASDILSNSIGQSIQANNSLLGAIPGLVGAGSMGLGGMGTWAQLAGILGNPTVVGQQHQQNGVIGPLTGGMMGGGGNPMSWGLGF